MQHEEYHALQKVERDHWFYKGKRALVRWWLDHALQPSKGMRILDAGAGTGELVKELRAAYASKGIAVIGLEYVETARTIGKELNGVDLLPGSILDIPFAAGYVEASIAMDVLEHVEDDARALSELIRITQSNGVVLINVPAFKSLWSDWDVSLGHFRRYDKAMFQRILAPHIAAGTVTIEYFDYISSLAFLPILLYRNLSRMFKIEARAEDSIPAPWLNNVMYRSFLAPATWRWYHPPFGSSLFVVLRKT